MASIKFSALVADVRGKVGGNIFARNRGGAYVKATATPTNPGSSKQSAARGIFATLMTEWRALSNANKSAWNSASYTGVNRVGDTIKYTGSVLYAKCNALLINAGLPQIDNPPASPISLTESWVDQKDQVAATAGDGELTAAPLTINVPGDAFKTDEYLHIMVSKPLSTGISSFRSVPYFINIPYPTDLSTLTPAGGQVTIDIFSEINTGLGPSIYNVDSQLAVDVGIFNSKEGFLRPLGKVFLEVPAYVPPGP